MVAKDDKEGINEAEKDLVILLTQKRATIDKITLASNSHWVFDSGAAAYICFDHHGFLELEFSIHFTSRLVTNME